MFIDSALSTAVRRRGFALTSLPPARAATASSRISLVKTFPRLASCAFLRPSIAINRPIGTTPVLCSAIPAANYSRAAVSGPEAAALQEGGHQASDLLGKHQPRMAGGYDRMVGQAGQAGLPDHDRAVVVAIEAV